MVIGYFIPVPPSFRCFVIISQRTRAFLFSPPHMKSFIFFLILFFIDLLVPFTLSLCDSFAVCNMFATFVLPFIPMFSIGHVCPNFCIPIIALLNVSFSDTVFPIISPNYASFEPSFIIMKFTLSDACVMFFFIALPSLIILVFPSCSSEYEAFS